MQTSHRLQLLTQASLTRRSDIYRDRPGLFALVFGAFGFPAGFTMIIVRGVHASCSYSVCSACSTTGQTTPRSCV